MDTAYNVQLAVDSETHLMVDYQMTNRVTDHGLLEPTAEGIKAEAGDRILEKGIIPNVVLPDGRDVYELEIAYEEATCDRESGRRRDKKVSACRDRAGSI
jgi:transposase